MDSRNRNLGFAASQSNIFKSLNTPMQIGGFAGDCGADTILQLDSMGPSIQYPTSRGVKRRFGLIDGTTGEQITSPLCLGLRQSSSSSDSKGSSITVCTAISSGKEADEESSRKLELDFTLHLGSKKMYVLKKDSSSNVKASGLQPKIDLELSLCTVHCESEITETDLDSPVLQVGKEVPHALSGARNAYEEPTAQLWKDGIPVAPSLCSHNAESSFFLVDTREKGDPTLIVRDLSSSVMTTTNSSVTWASGITKKVQSQHRSGTKTCQVEGCGKGARGASGRCISHGGGRRCHRSGCPKGAEGRTPYCKAHGGGRRCDFLGCTKSAEGRTDFCIAHGGGRRCSHEGCTKAARGKSGLCIRHGGGKRCQKENCTRSAEGLSGLCISHGGGRRCHSLGCTKGAQGSTMYCKAHGGGKRCTYPECNKGAEGSTPFCKGHGGGKRCLFGGGNVCTKSVHGGTNFCVAHGGGKRCAMPECTRSARGRTAFCVRHGGGKRCKAPECGKSAQGSTDFCKAHGGGKRCLWGHPGSEHGDRDSTPCVSFARGKTGLCTLHGGLVNDKRVHGATVVGPIVHEPTVTHPEKMNESAVTAEGVSNDIPNHESDMMSLAFPRGQFALPSASIFIPEGRVHGGSLMTMFVSGSSRGIVLDPPEPEKPGMVPQSWM